jgi:Transposase DDE domain
MRKGRSVRVDGYKRHVLHDLDTGLICAVGITPANDPEASVTETISADLAQQGVSLKELHIDRAYLSSQLVRERSEELEIYYKAWPVRVGKRFSKQAFFWIGTGRSFAAQQNRRCPLCLGAWCIFPKTSAPSAR